MTHYKILVADDDPDDREIMNEAFELNGFTRHLVLASAKEVLDYLDSVKRDEDLPHLIITDLNMPGMNGFELLQTLKSSERYHHIDVFVYSTSSMGSHVDLCLALGAKEYITKPDVLDEYQHLAVRFTSSVAE